MRSILFFIFFSLALESQAALTAKVLIVKGMATKLTPGARVAVPIRRGDVLLEDTSIVTQEKSFVKLKFSDNSTMNVAPKSMVNVSKMPKGKANVVKLFSGIVKAEVEKIKKKKSQTKLIVKTKNAVLGVRGTKFQSIYNTENGTTSLITVEGQVAMVKQKEARPKKKTKTTSKENKSIVEDEVDELDKAFDNAEDVIEVPAGKYTGVGAATEKPIEPVKIAPQQYNAIAKSMGSKKRAKDVMKVSSKDELSRAAKSSIKSGGYVDFATGLYVPPPKTAKFNSKTGTFQAPQIGKIDKKTGAFIPPKGVRVDPNKGLVIDKKEIAKIAAADRALIEKEVKAIKKSEAAVPLVVNKVKKKQKSKPSKSWGPSNHVLTAKFMPFSESVTVVNETNGSEADFFSREADWMFVTWKQDWGKRFSTRIRMGDSNYKFDESDVNIRYSDNRDGGNYMSVGMLYRQTKRLTFGLDLVDRTTYYLVPDGDNAVRFDESSIQILDVSARYYVSAFKRTRLYLEGILHLAGESRVPSFDDRGDDKGDTSGLSLAVEAEWMWKKNLGIYPSLYYRRMVQDGDDLEFTRNALGLGFDFIWDV